MPVQIRVTQKNTIATKESMTTFFVTNLDLPELLLPIRRYKMPPRAVGAVFVAGDLLVLVIHLTEYLLNIGYLVNT